MKYTEVLLMVRPSKISGVGVFTLTRIKKGEFIPLFKNGPARRLSLCGMSDEEKFLIRNYSATEIGKKWFYCPLDWHEMEIGWYLNHSEKNNAYHPPGIYKYYATRDIAAGEEITINYHLEEKENGEILPPVER